MATQIEAECGWARLLVLPAPGRANGGRPSCEHCTPPSRRSTLTGRRCQRRRRCDGGARLLRAPARSVRGDPRLGIAGGSAWERDNGVWRQRFVTGGSVWGATRAYRWQCLQDVLPLEERHGWDGIDQLKARAQGWRRKRSSISHFVITVLRVGRSRGGRTGSSTATPRTSWVPALVSGRANVAPRGRDPGAVGLIYGYVSAAARRLPRLEDPAARAMLRGDQSLRKILLRRRRREGCRWLGAGARRSRVAVGGRPSDAKTSPQRVRRLGYALRGRAPSGKGWLRSNTRRASRHNLAGRLRRAKCTVRTVLSSRRSRVKSDGRSTGSAGGTPKVDDHETGRTWI